MLAGNSTNFAFWYDVVERTSSFCYGPFNIFIDGKTVFNNSEDNFTLNIIASDLKRIIERLDNPDELPPGFDEDDVFEKAMHTHGYHTKSDPIFPESWWSESDPRISSLLDLFIEIESARRTNPPFGVELQMYSEVSDKGWRFFLFKSENKDVLIYSKDLGRTILCNKFPRGEVKKAVEDFLKKTLIIPDDK